MTAAPESNHRTLFDLSGCGVGASTGYMTANRGHWDLLVDLASSVSDKVIELSALSAPELPNLFTFLAESPTLDFSYVSVHGPAKGWLESREHLASQLASELPAYIDSVVMHPETLEDLDAFMVLGTKLILENMDGLKGDARTVEELVPYFDALPDAGFCFDVAHAQMNDPTMGLAHELLDAFGDRLREVHLSSIRDDGSHVPLLASDVAVFRPVLERCTHVPWILEAEPPKH